MQKIYTPVPNGGYPTYIDDLVMLQNEAASAIAALMGHSSTPTIMAGMLRTDHGNGTLTLTGGYIWLNHEMCRFEGYSGTYPVYITKSDAISTRTFRDGSQQNAIVYTTAVATTSQPGSGQYMTITNNSSMYTFATHLDNTLALANRLGTLDTKITNEVNYRASEVALERTKIDNHISAYNTQYANMQNVVNTKASASEADWIWAHNENNGGLVRKDNGGWVHFRALNLNAEGWPTITLPAGYRPSKQEFLYCPGMIYFTNNSTGITNSYYDILIFQIGTDGMISFWSTLYNEIGGYGDTYTIGWRTLISGCFYKAA